MSSIIKLYTFSPGATIVASEHNSNFDTIFNDYNTNITNVNIATNAGIIDTKLAQIATASKVSGTAITGLASIPSGAGSIPTLNGNVPIGAPIPWLKTLSGVPALPANWVECSGQTISDSDSPLDGVTLPDLNAGDLFLSGNTSSGGTAADLNKAHTHTGPSHQHALTTNGGAIGRDFLETADGATDSNTTYIAAAGDGATSSTGTATTYDVVYIMRIK